MDNRKIGILDSGIGGLTVLKEIIKILPNEQYIYYADTKNVPYGIKPKEKVKKYVKEAIEFLNSKNVKAIVIACNTATSIAIEDVRKLYNIPIIGIEPAVKPAMLNRSYKKILIMATPATIKEEKLKYLINKLEAKKYIDVIAMPKLVEFAEKRDFNSKEVIQYIFKQLKAYKLEEYSEIVLGCTHFPFFKKALGNVIPKDLKLIDGSLGVAKRLKKILEKEKKLGNLDLDIEYYYSGEKVENKEEITKLNNLIKGEDL